ncbi:hypothetical protein KKH27_09620 [bacterium]|nr:hypothetical protein [bacterium]MBU1984249.1 hypothetical protein [bacterium]
MHTSRNIPSIDTYSLLCEAWSDEPGQIDTAWVGYRDWPPAGMRLSTQSVWSALLASSYFSDPQLGSVVGQPFTFFFQASNDSIYMAGPVYLFRVIEATPTLTSPRNGEQVGPRPVLRWNAFTASYPFTLRVTVILTAGEYEAVVWSRDGLSASPSEVTVSDSLENGSYYWTLHVVDSFENTSRSKEGLFRVNAEVNL